MQFIDASHTIDALALDNTTDVTQHADRAETLDDAFQLDRSHAPLRFPAI